MHVVIYILTLSLYIYIYIIIIIIIQEGNHILSRKKTQPHYLLITICIVKNM